MLSLDPKPFGAFIEYTLKPIIEDARDLLDRMGGEISRDLLRSAVTVFIVDKIVNFFLTTTITVIVCYTAYCVASNSPLIPK